MRYSLVGGLAFLIDAGTLVLFKELVFRRLGSTGTIISTGIGFIAGIAFNYIFSNIFVFKNAKAKVSGRHLQSFSAFLLIGLVGLGFTELGMIAGITLFGDRFYLAVKVFVAGAVLIWNYGARKLIIYR
jgi:putative flippase GtrA